MNKTPATLISADHGVTRSRPAPDYIGIHEYETRAGQAYLSGQEVISYQMSPYSPAFWSHGWPLKTTNLFYGSAPEPWQKSANLQYQETPLYTAGQAPFGSAPTAGIYSGTNGTGVHEDGCT